MLPILRFNPCFSGCLSPVFVPYNNGAYSGVSILVLVDVFLQFLSTIQPLSMLIRFNPCFSGCLSPVFTLCQIIMVHILGFQSLF